MRTDQLIFCDVCEWVITVCVCPDGPTVLLRSDEDGAPSGG